MKPCENCGQADPFARRRTRPFLEKRPLIGGGFARRRQRTGPLCCWLCAMDLHAWRASYTFARYWADAVADAWALKISDAPRRRYPSRPWTGWRPGVTLDWGIEYPEREVDECERCEGRIDPDRVEDGCATCERCNRREREAQAVVGWYPTVAGDDVPY
jgi:hypothetical protein